MHRFHKIFNQRRTLLPKASRAICISLPPVTGLYLISLGVLGIGYADGWDDWDEDESNIAPMIESYQNLRQRSRDAFDELDEELGERPQRQKRDVKVKRGIKRIKRVKRVQRVQRKMNHTREETHSESVHPTPHRLPITRRKPSRRPSPSDFEAQVLKLVNRERAQGGDCGGRYFKPSPALNGQPQLARAAKRHALAMSEEHFFDHRGPRGDTPQSRIDDSGYQGRAWGENIAAGQRSPESVVRAWMKSPGHCRNILNPLFTELGVSFVFESQSPYKTYWVQAFGTPR